MHVRQVWGLLAGVWNVLAGGAYNLVLNCGYPHTSHVCIQGNERTDKAAKAALNEIPSNVTVPFSDYKPYIHTYVRKKWHDFWDNQIENKLHSVQPALGYWPLSCRSNRREELVFSRLRIGHSYLTHSHLLVGDTPQSVFRVRNVSQWITSLFIDHVNNLKEMFDLGNPANIVCF